MFGFVMIRGPPSSTLFPYTTLYGSRDPPRGILQRQSWRERAGDPRPAVGSDPAGREEVGEVGRPDPARRELAGAVEVERSGGGGSEGERLGRGVSCPGAGAGGEGRGLQPGGGGGHPRRPGQRQRDWESTRLH